MSRAVITSACFIPFGLHAAIGVYISAVPAAFNDGVQIHYEVVGEGPPILLLHGGAEDHRIWILAGYVDRLRDRRCILIDRRGYGQSDRPRTIRSHRIGMHVADAVAVLDDLGVTSSVVWGFSNGGLMALALAASRPERVRALVVHDGFRSRTVGSPRRNGSRMASEVRSNFPAFMRATEKREAGPWPEDIMRYHLETDTETFALELEAWDSWVGVDPLTIAAPTLLLESPSEDRQRGYYKEVTALMPRASVVDLPGGHFLSFLRSDLVVPAVTGFIGLVSSPSSRSLGESQPSSLVGD